MAEVIGVVGSAISVVQVGISWGSPLLALWNLMIYVPSIYYERDAARVKYLSQNSRNTNSLLHTSSC
jgi:hypothetical protein